MEGFMAIVFVVASVSSTSTPCTNCDGNNVTCADSVCRPRCVNETSSGECLPCLDSRFYGKQCQHDCPDACFNSRCQMNNTRVVCTEGCVAGKKGDNCEVKCPTDCTQCERYGDGCAGPCQNPQYYGPHCRTHCPSNCSGGCNRITGECDSCEPGHTGDKCNVTCHSNCRGRCNSTTWECESCEPGHTGDKCNVTCPSNCRGGCNSTTWECESCEQGYGGKNYNTTCATNCTDECALDTQGNNTTIPTVITVGILGLVMLMATILLVCNRRRSTTKTVAADIEEDVSDHSYDYVDDTFFDMQVKGANAVPVDGDYNTLDIRCSHPTWASTDAPGSADQQEVVIAPVLERCLDSFSNGITVVELTRPCVRIHYFNTPPSSTEILID